LTSWAAVNVSDVCELIVDCVNRTAPLSSVPTRFKMIRTTNVRNGFIDTQNVRYVDEATFQRWTRRGAPRLGDVVLTREAPLGEVGIIRTTEPVFLGQRTIMYRADHRRVHPYFLMYAMLGPLVQGQIRGYGSGSTVEHMRLSDCFNLRLLLPPLSVQHRVAAILSAYDDLIENNNRRIKIMEEMAQRIFHDWFIEFRYPGHQTVPKIDSTLGPIPQGWSAMAVSEAISIDPKTPVLKGVAVPFVPMRSVSENTMHIWPIEARVSTSGARFVNSDTLLARISPCLENGKTAYVQCLETGQAAIGSTEFIVFRPQRLSAEAVYLLARSDGFRRRAIKSMSGATGRQRVRKEAFDSYFVAVPDADLLSVFGGIIKPMFDESYRLFSANRTLHATRDLLLPGLISGEIDVEALDIPTEDLAA
jgi:type I restriction enzyme, S subunit